MHRFELVFHAVGSRPTTPGDYLLFNQCDGFHVVQARFVDGEFSGFHFFAGPEAGEDFYVAWAKLPDPVHEMFRIFGRQRGYDLKVYGPSPGELPAEMRRQLAPLPAGVIGQDAVAQPTSDQELLARAYRAIVILRSRRADQVQRMTHEEWQQLGNDMRERIGPAAVEEAYRLTGVTG